MQGNEVGVGEQLLHVGSQIAELLFLVLGDMAVIGDDLHAQALAGDVNDLLADLAPADQAQGLAAHVVAIDLTDLVPST